jgi:hypothetical protein
MSLATGADVHLFAGMFTASSHRRRRREPGRICAPRSSTLRWSLCEPQHLLFNASDSRSSASVPLAPFDCSKCSSQSLVASNCSQPPTDGLSAARETNGPLDFVREVPQSPISSRVIVDRPPAVEDADSLTQRHWFESQAQD